MEGPQKNVRSMVYTVLALTFVLRVWKSYACIAKLYLMVNEVLGFLSNLPPQRYQKTKN